MILIIGYGSLLRGDDGIGQLLAEALHERLPHAVTVSTNQLTPELAAQMSEAENVYFIDACAEGSPGQLAVRWVEPCHDGGAFTHHVTPETLLGAAHDLYGYTPDTELITISGASFGNADHLSPELEKMLPELVVTLQNEIEISQIRGS